MKNSLHTLNTSLLLLFIFLLPTQLGKHFFLDFSYISGIRIDYLAPTLYITDIIAVLLFALNWKVLYHALKNDWFKIVGICLLLNILFSLVTPMAFYKNLKIIEVIFIYLIFVKTPLPTLWTIGTFFIGGAIELGLATAQLITKHSVQGVFYWLGERYLTLSMPDIAKSTMEGVQILRPYGTFSHPNSLAGFYLLIFFFFLTDKRFAVHAVWKNTLLFLSAALVFFSFSKTAIIIFFVFNIVYIITNRTHLFCRFCAIVRPIVFAALTLLFLSTKGDPLTITKRLQLIESSIIITLTHPLFGVGAGNYLYAQSLFPIRQPYFFLQPVHNIILLFLSEYGLILGGIILWYLWSWVRFHKKNSTFLYGIAIVLATGMMDHYWLTLQQNLLVAAVIFGIANQSELPKKVEQFVDRKKALLRRR